jgi:hypothetical protein
MECVKIIPKSDYGTLKLITSEYLSGTDISDLNKMCENFPSAITGYYVDEKMIGVCYGFEINYENFALDGIAIIEPYNKSGRGGKLIAFFEQCVSSRGYKFISLGSANGYVERFYIKHGYTPIELKVYVENNEWELKSKNYIYPVTYTQAEGKYIKLVITVVDYYSMNQKEIKEHYNGLKSFFVFKKQI